jgi:uncharacterized membrane protein
MQPQPYPKRRFLAYRDDARPGDDRLRAEVRLAKHPIHPMLVPFPIVCFVGALVTDIAYASTAEMMWADFSAWLLVVGMITGVLAGIGGLIDLLRNRLIRAQGRAWLHMIGNIIVLLLALFNTLIHTRDAWTSVVPIGLVLSVIVVLILCFTTWLGRSMVYRHGFGAIG